MNDVNCFLYSTAPYTLCSLRLNESVTINMAIVCVSFCDFVYQKTYKSSMRDMSIFDISIANVGKIGKNIKNGHINATSTFTSLLLGY